MIRACTADDFEAIYTVINDAAHAYEGVIPADCWHEPYMKRTELESEIAAGVTFSGFQRDGRLVGVIGLQPVKDVTLIRHAYVAAAAQRHGIGSKLLARARRSNETPVLIGTWAAATWAIGFYEKHGFTVVSDAEKTRLLKIYWTVSERQIATSVVLADGAWFERG